MAGKGREPMSLQYLLETQPMHEIERSALGHSKEGVSFTGAPRKHPYDSSKFLLFVKEGIEQAEILELKLADLLAIESLPTEVDESGSGVTMMRVFTRKGAHGIRL